MGRCELAVIVPAFNEAGSIERVVRSVMAFGDAIVVDDASADGTAEAARRAGAVVIQGSVNLGYDGALNAGFAEAARRGASYVATFDADGQHDASLLPRFIDHLRNGSWIAVGVRPRVARAAEAIFAGYTRWRFGVPDPLCGMKAYRIELYEEVGHFDCYRSIGTELLLHALRTRRTIAAVPVPISRRDGAPRFGGILRSNLRVLRALVIHFLGLCVHAERIPAR